MKKLLQIYTWLRWRLYDEDYCLFFFFCLILALLVCCGCKSPKHINTETVVRYIDSTVISYRDSLIEVEIPKEKIVNIVALPDTLNMETSLATAKCWVDTTITPNALKGELENKKDGVLIKTVYLPSKERIVYRDSIQTKEVEVPIEVVKYKTPKWAWYVLLGFASALAFIFRKQVFRLVKLLVGLF